MLPIKGLGLERGVSDIAKANLFAIGSRSINRTNYRKTEIGPYDRFSVNVEFSRKSVLTLQFLLFSYLLRRSQNPCNINKMGILLDQAGIENYRATSGVFHKYCGFLAVVAFINHILTVNLRKVLSMLILTASFIILCPSTTG